MKSICALSLIFTSLSFQIIACTGGTSNGSLTPTVAYQTQSVLDGQYYTINVTACNIYYFTFCSNGGSATWDTQLTLLDAGGTTELAYSDDACSLQSSISWTATYTGTARILISLYNCSHTLTSSATMAYAYAPKTGNYCLTDNASYITVGGESCIQLTPEVNNNKGCAWYDTQVDFNYDFSINMDFYFGNNINGADGSTITFQPNSPTACGTAGGELGTGGLSNALVIEFDTYDNDNPTHAVDIAADHIAIDTDGSLQNSTHKAGPIAAISGGSNIDDGNQHTVEIVWIDNTNTLEVYFDGALRLSVSEDFVSTLFGGDNTVYWGATASTGGLNNQQYLCPDNPVVLPVELISFEALCRDEKNYLVWSTASELGLNRFVIEQTIDGILYQSIGSVTASGGNSYQYELPETNESVYYRLKMVDNNGTTTSTEIISGQKCIKQDFSLINSFFLENQALKLNFNEPNLSIRILDLTGKIILEENSTTMQTASYLIPQLSQGIYYLQVENAEGTKREIRRVFHQVK